MPVSRTVPHDMVANILNSISNWSGTFKSIASDNSAPKITAVSSKKEKSVPGNNGVNQSVSALSLEQFNSNFFVGIMVFALVMKALGRNID